MDQRPDNRRVFPRVDLLAQVQVTRQSECHIMSTLNISRGGVFIQGLPTNYPELRIGAEVELVIFDANAPGERDIALRARIVRLDLGRPGHPPGFGLEFVGLDPERIARLDQMIGARRPAPPARR